VDAAALIRPYTLCALLFSLVWASGFVAIKIAMQGMPPLTLQSVRFVIAGAGVLAWVRWRSGAWPARREWPAMVLMAVLTQVVYLGVTAITLQHISAGMGTVLASTNPLLLALVAPWALGERLTLLKATGLLVSYAGVAWVMWRRIGPDNEPGAMAVFLAAIGFMVAGTIVFKRVRVEHLLAFTGGQLLVAGLILAIPAAIRETPVHMTVTPEFVLAFAYLLLGVSIGGGVLWFWLLRHGDATRASAYFFLNPVMGLLLGAVFLGEPFRVQDLVGSAVVTLGIYLVQRA